MMAAHLFRDRPHSPTEPLSTFANTLWNAAGCFFYLGCQWATTVLVVLLTSSYSDSGLLAFAMSIGNIFQSIALFKVRTYQVSDIEYEFSFSDYVFFRFASLAVAAFTAITYLFVTTNGSGFILISLVYLLFKADESFVDVLHGTVQRHGRMDYIGKSQFLRGCATIVGFICVLAITKNLFAAIIGMTVLCLCITVLYDRRNALLFESIGTSFEKGRLIALGRACLLPMLASLCANSIVSIARQEYGLLQGEEMLGIYASISTPAVLIQVAASYLYSPLYGKLAEALRDDGFAGFKHAFLKILGIIVVIISLLIALLSIFGSNLLVLVYGSTIAPYLGVFPLVLAMTGCMGVLFYVNDMLIVAREGAVQLVSNAIALIVTVIAVPFLIERIGMNGINVGAMAGISVAIAIGLIRILTERDRS